MEIRREEHAEELGRPIVFISAVTSELREERDSLAEILREYVGDDNVIVQETYPNNLSDGFAIQNAIEQAKLVICLIGHSYGAELPPGNRPPAARPDCSWTQWEYWYARELAKDRLVFLFEGSKVKGPEPIFSDRQSSFRKCVEEEETNTFGGPFFYRFDTFEKLKKDITHSLERSDGALVKFQDAAWMEIKKAYREGRIKTWEDNFPCVYHGAETTSSDEKSALMLKKQPPFIASQGFSILVPGSDGAQSRHLKPDAFLPGRDSEANASARADSTWRGLKREEIVEALRLSNAPAFQLADIMLPQPRRLFLISGGGVGKTTNMRWLEAALNGLDTSARRNASTQSSDVFAVLVGADQLIGQDDAGVLAVLTDKITHDIKKKADTWSKNVIERGLLKDGVEGYLVILIDGLDHVETGDIDFLTSIQSRLPGRSWSSCGVVAAGRPHAILGWEEAPADIEKRVAVGNWRFLKPAEFEPHEAKIFLGTSDGESRHEVVADKVGQLIRVPRVLEYVRSLSKDQLAGVRTSADIYTKATRELVKRTLMEGGERTRTIGPGWEKDCKCRIPPSKQIDYVMKLLSALAFIALCPTTNAAPRISRKTSPLIIGSQVEDDLWARMAADNSESESKALARDLRALASFSSIIGNGLLDATDTDGDTLRSVVWSNRTIQQFLAAYWLARHACGFEAVSARLQESPVTFEEGDLRRDAERFRDYVFYPEADYLDSRYERTDVTYELNQFLAEMPVAVLNAKSWVAAASAWYDPDPPAELGEAARLQRSWAAEMLYRSWPTMLDIAGWPLDDWWDLPYEKLILRTSGRDRSGASLHAERQQPQINDKRVSNVAREILERFFSDFGLILNGEHGSDQQKTAREMIADKHWIAVGAGSFRMGAPPGKQGFSGKTKAYWNNKLDAIQAGEVTAKIVAEEAVKKEWTTGAQGERLRKRDIQWLIDTFHPLEPTPGISALEGANRNAPEYRNALEALENNWSRRDETPVQNPQKVAAFTMHRFPILRRWFYLFAPGHRDTVASYLTLSGRTRVPDHDDHPAIYINWYDAWAFCQWATWTIKDPGASSERRYGLRLPHEPEWEYAASWTTDDVGNPKQIPYGQRYWWGDAFYQDEDKPTEEQLSKDVAHAKGHPDDTRALAVTLTPNGLGFYDILGNVWEWTANLYNEKDAFSLESPYSRSNPTIRPPVNCPRTMRGGLWYFFDLLASCSNRFRLYCDDRDYKMGFRVVREERSLI